MVGVAGKSKGCSTCRKRKKGCDLARPSCGQCLKSGKICGGYQRDLTFIHHKIPGKEQQLFSDSQKAPYHNAFHSDGDAPSNANSSRSSPLSSSAGIESPSAFAYQDWDNSFAVVQQQSSRSPSLQVLPSSLTLTALTALHSSVFNAFFLPRNSLAIQDSTAPLAHPATWTQIIPPLLNNDLSLQLAYLAISSSRIGHDNHDDNLLAAGKKFYGKALRETQRAIADPKRRHTEETLLACSTLGHYEMYDQTLPRTQSSSEPNGWLFHSAAVARLLEARGPDSYTTEKGHAVFLHARILITIRSVTARRACFLSKPDWLTVPWRNHPKNMQHKLVDIMVFLPVVLQTFDNMESDTSLDSNARRRQREALLARCAALVDDLQNWYTQLCAEANGRSLWHVLPPDDPSYPFQLSYSFDDHLYAYTLMLYWTCNLVFQSRMHQLQNLLNQDIDDLQHFITLPDSINPRFYAISIAQSLPYFFHPDMGALGPNLALFPVGMAFGFFASPTQPSNAPDTIVMKSTGTMMNNMMLGQDPDLDRSNKEILLWFVRLFAGLSTRSLPGGAFLSSLMKSLGDASGLASFP